jgi:hypothetical protein
MTNELGPHEYIKEFVPGGPKNYACRIVNARTLEKKTVCKMRGITPQLSSSTLTIYGI